MTKQRRQKKNVQDAAREFSCQITRTDELAASVATQNLRNNQ